MIQAQHTQPPLLRWTRADWLALALLLALTLFYHSPLFLPHGGPIRSTAHYSYPEGDFYDQFHAFAVYEHDRLWSGQLPLWNPYTLGGHPFWADVQAAVLYPPSLLTIALSGPGTFSPLWLELEAALHFYLGALFTYLFVRRLLYAHVPPGPAGRHIAAPLIAALTFAFGGYLAGYPSQQLAVLETQIWLPLLLLLLDVGLAQERRRALLGAGLVWGLALLAGHPQSAMYLFYVALLYGLYRLAQLGLRWIRSLRTQLTWIGIGLGLAAVSWLPAYEFMRLSVRSSLSYEELAGGLALRDLVQFLVPDVFTYWSPTYVGILPLALAFLGGWYGIRRSRLGRQVAAPFWVSLALVSLVLSLGGNAFLYRLFYWAVPGFRLFRSQERAIYVTSFALAVLAGVGWHLFSSGASLIAAQRTHRSPVRYMGHLLLVLSASSLLTLAVIWRVGSGQAEFELQNWLKPLLLCSALAVSAWALVRWVPRTSSWAGALALLLVWIDLMLVNMPRNLHPGAVESRVYDRRWLEPVLEDESFYRTANEWGLPGNVGCLLRREDLYGASPLRLQAHKDMTDALPHWRLWQLFGVRYVTTWEHDCPAPYECYTIARQGQEWAKDTVYLHRIIPHFPRAWIAGHARVVEDSKALALLADPDFDPFTEVLVSSAPAGFVASAQKAGSTIELLGRTPEQMHLRANLTAPGWLVLSEWIYPGWQARVNGHRQQIYRADYGLRAIALPTGTHDVSFVYRPITLYVGAALSLSTLLLCALKARARYA